MRLPIAAALLVLLTGCASGTDPRPVPQAAGGTPHGWKVESYRAVTLVVPEEWVPGYSPMTRAYDGSPEMLWCPNNPDATPYVGRPLFGTDVCNGDPDSIRNHAFDETEAVWFDSPLEVGRIDGTIPVTTVQVGVSRVTVAVKDPEVRGRILDSVREIDGEDPNGCPAVPVPPDVGAVDPGEVRSLSVCVYDHGEQSLLWSGRVGAPAAEALVAAVEASPTSTIARNERAPYQHVDLLLHGERTARWRALPDLVGMYADGRRLALTPALVRPWAGAGIKAYVVGGGRGEIYRFYRGIIG